MPESLHQPNDALRRAREERGWTQNDAALALGCSLEAVQSWERGRRSRPGPRWRARLCEVYQRSPEELGLVPAPPQHTKTAAAQEVSATSLAACEPEDAIAETKRQGDVPDVFKARRQTEEHSSPSPKGERSRRVLLARGRKNWIDGVLHPCLQEAGLLQLDLVECPDALAHPRSPSTRERTAVAHPLPAGTSLDQLYHLTGDLLVLGERGAGKTTLLLDLFEDLLAHAEDWECEPMPVVFPLASWSGKHTSLAEWLVEVLEEDYFIAKQVGHHWIDTDRLIVLLDDLHQVPEALRQGCVEAIDAYQKAHPEVPLVVCCQTEAYFAQPIRLRFSQAVEIQPLTPAHIVQYLDRVSGQQAVRQAVLEDRHLREFCSNPFLLRLMVELTNQGEATTALALTGSREARRQQLFDVYVHRQQHDSLSAPSSEEQTITSLSWLARQMTLHHQSTYYVERMQPTWLPDQQAQQKYRLKVTRLFGAMTALLFSGLLACFRGDFGPQNRGFLFWLGGGHGDSVLGWMAPGIGGGMSGSISLALLFALVVILVNLFGDRKRIPTFSRRTMQNALSVGLRWGLLTGGVIGIIAGIIFSRDPGFTCLGGSISGITCGGSLGFFGGILIGFQVGLILLLRHHTRLHGGRAQAKHQAFSLRHCLVNALLFGSCGSAGFALVYCWQAGGISAPGIGYSLISGVYFGLLYHQGIEAGGGPEIGLTIQLAETVTWSWEAVWSHVLDNARKGMVLAGLLLVCVVTMITCISSIFYGVSYGARYGLIFGVVVAAISGITGMLMGILTSGWSHTLLDERALTRPGEGIRRARRNALFAACLFGPIGGLSSGLASALAFALGGVSGWPTLGVGLALILTLACWYEIFMLYGGIALVEHYILRWCLWRERLLPWKCFAFFQHAVERVLLKKWGGGYTFLHSSLQDYFAEYEKTHWEQRR